MAPRSEREREDERQRLREWFSSFDELIARDGEAAGGRLLAQLIGRAARSGIDVPHPSTTPYVNTIPKSWQPAFPGDLEMERRIEALVRWNAMAMVVRGNRRQKGIGGHLSTYASAATLFEIGFNHFFRGKDDAGGGDQLYLQGHASPGVYARAFLEGRLQQRQLENFRRELQPGGGLSSYPHPWLMPTFWEFPTVSMGLSPLMAVYQARFNRYLEHQGLREQTGRVWAVVGDGEMDEPESVGALSMAAREQLGNLTLVVNCNLQRLDGPVRGNGKIIQELEALFRGAGWQVLKVIWGEDWDPLLDRDDSGVLVERMNEALDGHYQKYVVEGGAYMREHFFGTDSVLAELLEGKSDEDLDDLAHDRGGHDLKKLYAAYAAATETPNQPTVILAKTIKGDELGEATEGRNVTHKTKDLEAEHLRNMRDRLGIPIPDDQVEDAPFYRPEQGSPELEYLQERRHALGGMVPNRTIQAPPLPPVPDELLAAYRDEGSGGREATTTMVMVRMVSDLLKDDTLGPCIVPIVPDEARTFGVEALFPQVGIYAPAGQHYEPVDADSLLSYDERETGRILEEGISEAGSMGSFIAAGTAHATHGLNAIPFFFFYSMFGFQRVGDFIWAAGDSRARGFLIGATSGRTTLNGEGLQHQDGHSHVMAYSHPTVRAYDPAYAYELATIVEDGTRRMFVEGEDLIYYVTVANEPYEHPPMPEGVRDGILRGMYRLQPSSKSGEVRRVGLLASGTMVQQALQAQTMLEDDYGVTADVWSVTSWKALYEDAMEIQRWNRLHPGDRKTPYLRICLGEDPGVVVGVSDYVKALPHSLAPFLPERLVALGTDGFGRSDSRDALREFFEVDARHITHAALQGLADAERYPQGSVDRAVETLNIARDKPDPRHQ